MEVHSWKQFSVFSVQFSVDKTWLEWLVERGWDNVVGCRGSQLGTSTSTNSLQASDFSCRWAAVTDAAHRLRRTMNYSRYELPTTDNSTMGLILPFRIPISAFRIPQTPRP